MLSAATKNRWNVTVNAVIALVLALGSFTAWHKITQPAPSASVPADWGKSVGTLIRVPRRSDGLYVVSVRINNELTENFIVDSGAADVQIFTLTVASLSLKGSIQDSDFTGAKDFGMANGATVTSETFRIRSLQVGDVVVKNVAGSVGSVSLLGQSFLSRFKSWSIDNARHELLLQY